MDADFFDRLWQDHRPNENGMVEFWNNRAASFNAHKSAADSKENRRILADQLAARAGLDAHSRVLDIGCGSGHYALAFAQRAGEVAGFDIAPKMVEFAQENANAAGVGNVSFEVLDWERADLAQKGWEKAFDLVLAINTPAVNNRAALEKMMVASRRHCCLISKVDTENAVRDGLKRFVEWDEAKARVSRAFFSVFNLLWLLGYYPEVNYITRSWEDDMTLDEALTVHLRYFDSVAPLTPEQKQAMTDALTAMARDGMIHEKVTSKIGVVLWEI